MSRMNLGVIPDRSAHIMGKLDLNLPATGRSHYSQSAYIAGESLMEELQVSACLNVVLLNPARVAQLRV